MTGALCYILKLFVLASWQGFDRPIDPKINLYLCLDMTYPPAKFDVDWSKETQVIIKNLMFHLKPLFLACWQGLYSPIDPKNNPQMCLDMIYQPAKFDVDWSKETQVILKKLMFDVHPTTDILILITSFHLVITWLTIKVPIIFKSYSVE